MYRLSTHIEYLLLRNDCVVIPGFGAFINVRNAAFFDPERQEWHPMTREVRFNKALAHDDGLLANSYARKENVSFQTGRQLMNQDIESLKRVLTDEGEATLGNLGILNSNAGSVSFAPRFSADRLSLLMGYGMAPVQMRETQKPSITEPEREMSSGQFDTSRNYYIPVNKIFAKVAASLLMVMAVALAIVLPVSDRNKVDKASVLPVESLINSVAVPTESTELSVAETPAEAPETETLAETQNPSVPIFHAVVATFNTKAEAEKFIEMNSDSGYPLQIVSTKTKSRVSAMSSSSKEEIYAMMREGDFHDTFSQAWVWESENSN